MSIYKNSKVGKLEILESTLTITTISREHGRNGSFLILRDAFESWFKDGSNSNGYVFRDCYGFCEVSNLWNSDCVRFELMWIGSSFDNIRGFRQYVDVPRRTIENLLYLGKSAISILSYDVPHRTKYEFVGEVGSELRNIANDSRIKRALVKFFRQHMNSGSDLHYKISGDGKYDFYFTCYYPNGRYSHNGGIILHAAPIKHGCSPLFYSVHT